MGLPGVCGVLLRSPAFRAVFADQVLAMVFHRFGIVGDVGLMPPIAVERKLESADAVFLFETDTQVLILVTAEAFVVQADVNQLLLAKHDAARDWMVHAVGALQHFLGVIDQQVVAGNCIRVAILIKVEVEEVQEIEVDVIIGINPDDVFRFCRQNSTIDGSGKPDVSLIGYGMYGVVKQFESVWRAIGTAVVDHDDFIAFVGYGLMQQRAQAAANEFFLVVGGHDHRNERPFLAHDFIAFSIARRARLGTSSTNLTPTGRDTARDRMAFDCGKAASRFPPCAATSSGMCFQVPAKCHV